MPLPLHKLGELFHITVLLSIPTMGASLVGKIGVSFRDVDIGLAQIETRTQSQRNKLSGSV